MVGDWSTRRQGLGAPADPLRGHAPVPRVKGPALDDSRDIRGACCNIGRGPERSHRGRVRRFAKPLSGVTRSEGSNPSLSASPARSGRPTRDGHSVGAAVDLDVEAR